MSSLERGEGGGSNSAQFFDCIGFISCTVRRDSVNLNYVADMVKKQRNAPINEFEISHDSSSKTWYVQGLGLQRFVQMTNWRYGSVCSLILSLPSCLLPFIKCLFLLFPFGLASLWKHILVVACWT